MKKHLQNLLLTTSAVLLLITGITFSVQAQELNTVWERTSRTGAPEPLPSWFTVGWVRGMDLHGENLYAADRANSQIRVLNATTGADVTLTTPYDLTGVAGGTYAMNDIAFSDDGVAFLGNLTTNASTNPFHLYWWTGEGGTYSDSLVITTSTSQRLGDKFTVVGSVTDNTVEVWIPVASSDPGIIYVLTTADQGATWNTETITLSGTNVVVGSNADVTPLGTGRSSDFYIGGNSSAPARYTSTGAYVDNSALASASRNGMQAFTYDSKDHLAVYSYRADGSGGGNKTGKVYIYDVSDAAAPTIVAESALMGDDTDTFSSIYGEAKVSLNEDGTYNVYALEGVNGLAAFTNGTLPVVDAPSNLIFSEYIEGSSNNKALEITNLSDSTVILQNYRIAQSVNGGGWEFYHTFKEDASIAAGAQYVILNASVDASFFAAENADEVLGFPSPVHHNGDDARGIIHIDSQTGDTTWVDVFGDPDNDPGSGWDVAGVERGTQNFTLVRKDTVTAGNTTALGSFGTNFDDSEWIIKNTNIFTNLGLATEAQAALAGDYFIPQRTTDAEGFISLHQAIHYVNTDGISSSTNLILTGDLTESSTLRLNRDDFSETNNLTIKPEAGEQVTVQVDDFRFVDTRHITIDGSNNGTDTRDLTFEKSGTASGFLRLVSYNRFIDIKNINLTYAADNGLSTYAVLINRREASTETGRAENVTFKNVAIGTAEKPFRDAFWLFGSTSNESFFHLNVSLLGGEGHVGRSFFRSQTHTNTVISGNKIFSYGSETGDNQVVNLNTPIDTFTFTNNEVVFANAAGTEDRTYIGLNATNTLVDTVNVSNNTFSNAGFGGTGTNNSFIAFYHNGSSSSAEFQFLHNSVNFTENGQTGTHAAIARSASASASATVQAFNNIFVNNQDGSGSYIYDWDGNTLFTNSNNIVVSANAFVANFDDEVYATLSAFSDSLGLDNLSTEAEVNFVSGTDLRLTGSSIGNNELAGIPIASVSTDIDGTARSSVAPYKGAFEGDVELMADVEVTIDAFSVLTPADDSSFDLGTGAETEVTFTWEEATSNAEVTYVFMLDSANADFSNPLFTIESDNDGSATALTGTYAVIDSTLKDLGVLSGESIDLKWTVMAVASDSTRMAENAFNISFTTMIGVSNEPEELPLTFKLNQNYPNPFNPTSTIQFTLPQSGDVRLDVFTITGQLVTTLVNSRMGSGEHSVTFDGSNLASGVYIYRIMAGNNVQTKRMTLIK
ncbi:MAG: SusE domain-containing protein [Balneola sp.]|nr:SusE domain-containing protein [Balneola sp.]MBO6649459.1 SusE domain-containing protein [Balneola sp.]MBO6711274.1 SusE domain-containing protein [Balneola sp.]MBO6800611.1 SusE domain-containing protein [Balneola sp.]MBO6869209.1 SusE domain-containing protein [Balneola sp.]